MTVNDYLATLKANPDEDSSPALQFEQGLTLSADLKKAANGFPYVRYFFSQARDYLHLYQKDVVMSAQLNLIITVEKIATEENPRGAANEDAIKHLFWKTAEIRTFVNEYEYGSLIKGGVMQTGETAPTRQPDGSFKAFRFFDFQYRSI